MTLPVPTGKSSDFTPFASFRAGGRPLLAARMTESICEVSVAQNSGRPSATRATWSGRALTEGLQRHG